MGPVRGERNEGVIASHLTVIALSIPYWSFVTSGRFPVARAFSQCFLRAPIRNRNRKGGKKIRKCEAFYWFPNLLLLKAAFSRLDFGPAYYEDPGSRGSYAAAFPGPFLLVLRPEAIASS
ncbi:hypothetical protein Lal_00019118 [Lupinus albus]|nr:hypothetical protein Lal_00019118 [Lupinus albus]